MFRTFLKSAFRRCRDDRWLMLAVLSGILVAGCGHEQKADVPSASTPPTVRLTQPQVRTIVRTVGQPSFVEAYERTSIYPKMSAYIEKWYVDIGDRVKQGQVLADLFVPEIKEDYQTKEATVELNKRQVELALTTVKVARADVKAADARVVSAKAILERYQSEVDRWDSEVTRLAKEAKGGVVDRQILDESRNQLRSNTAARNAAQADILKSEADFESAQASEQKAEVSVDVAKANLDVATSDWKRMKAWVGYLKLYAPFDGRIVSRNANTGDFVLPASGDPTAYRNSPFLSPDSKAAPIYVVDRTDVVRVFVDIPEQDANFVREGSKAWLHIRAFSDRSIPAAVTRTAWALNVKSRTLRAEIDLSNDEIAKLYKDLGQHQAADNNSSTGVQILPGMYAYGKVVIERPKAFVLPNTALYYRGEKTYVWTCQNNRANRCEVQLGVSDGEWIEITSRQKLTDTEKDGSPWEPIDGSEKIILGDLSVLTDGDAVTVASDEPTSASKVGNAPADTGRR